MGQSCNVRARAYDFNVRFLSLGCCSLCVSYKFLFPGRVAGLRTSRNKPRGRPRKTLELAQTAQAVITAEVDGELH